MVSALILCLSIQLVEEELELMLKEESVLQAKRNTARIGQLRHAKERSAEASTVINGSLSRPEDKKRFELFGVNLVFGFIKCVKIVILCVSSFIWMLCALADVS